MKGGDNQNPFPAVVTSWWSEDHWRSVRSERLATATLLHITPGCPCGEDTGLEWAWLTYLTWNPQSMWWGKAAAANTLLHGRPREDSEGKATNSNWISSHDCTGITIALVQRSIDIKHSPVGHHWKGGLYAKSCHPHGGLQRCRGQSSRVFASLTQSREDHLSSTALCLVPNKVPGTFGGHNKYLFRWMILLWTKGHMLPWQAQGRPALQSHKLKHLQ